MSPQNSNMVMVVMVIMISSLVVMSDSVTVDVRECYKVWVDECKFGLLKEICTDPSDRPQSTCCGLIADKKISWDCYNAIIKDLINHYPCKNPGLAPSLAIDMFTDCMG
ncbi:hypothetical protein AAHA92_19393 [Salvia divinorum]|uniref:Bifunctional inhibitor/plant lipid transfer protein/seed storage helical domain-containing protein n=1 Tax=Salvia divinorum TaxID=28513 RepID=A0ABD1H572_SALDI